MSKVALKTNVNITGRAAIKAALGDQVRLIKGTTERGLVRAAIHIQREAVKITPRDTGNLRASAYVVSNSAVGHLPTPKFSNRRKDAGRQAANRVSAIADARQRVSGYNPKVEIGFATTYAAAVHERQRNYKIGENKFLEKAVQRNITKILELVRRG